MNRFTKSAERGDAVAQYRLGLAYCLGRGVKKDYSEAVKWLRRSADQGHAKAQYYLGFCYSVGKGVAKDAQTAYGWSLLAVSGGYDKASSMLRSLKKSLSPSGKQAAQSWARQWEPSAQ